MSKSEEKKQAILLRRKGGSIKEIARNLGVSRSSVSTWVRDVSLTKTQYERLKQKMIDGGHAGRLIGAAWNKQQRRNRLASYKEDAERELTQFSRRNLFYIGLGLYWGEGFKALGGAAGFSNSDPRVVGLMITWFEQCLHISRDRLVVQIFINDIHKNRVRDIQVYWREITGLPESQFRKVVLLPKAKKFYENKNSYYGVCAVRILRGTEVKDRVNALIQRSFDIHRQCRPV